MHLTNGTTKKQNVQSLIKTEPLKIELSKITESVDSKKVNRPQKSDVH